MTEESRNPQTKRGAAFMEGLRRLIPQGLMTPFREEQLEISVRAIEDEARPTVEQLRDILDAAEGDGVIGPDYTPAGLAEYIVAALDEVGAASEGEK